MSAGRVFGGRWTVKQRYKQELRGDAAASVGTKFHTLILETTTVLHGELVRGGGGLTLRVSDAAHPRLP